MLSFSTLRNIIRWFVTMRVHAYWFAVLWMLALWGASAEDLAPGQLYRAPSGLMWKSYSQKNQDRFVLNTLGYPRGGFYVDVACFKPFFTSNTASLEKHFGWNGICIDGNANSIKEWRGVRNCTTVHAIVDEVSGRTVEFINALGLGGIIADDVDNNPRIRERRIAAARATNHTYFGTTSMLNTILFEHSAPRVIQYLSLDVEGAEDRVLRSGVLAEYVFQVLTIERPSPAAHAALDAHGYWLVKSVDARGIDRAPYTESFYVHSSVAKTISGLTRRQYLPHIARKNT